MREKKHTGSALPGECLLSKVFSRSTGGTGVSTSTLGVVGPCALRNLHVLCDQKLSLARIAKTTRTAQRKILPLQTPRRHSQGITGGQGGRKLGSHYKCRGAAEGRILESHDIRSETAARNESVQSAVKRITSRRNLAPRRLLEEPR